MHERLDITKHFLVIIVRKSVNNYAVCALDVELYLLVRRILHKYRHSLAVTVKFYFSEKLERLYFLIV